MKITPRKYAQALAAALDGGSPPELAVKNLMLLLRKKKQFKLLSKVIQSFEELWARQRGIVKMAVIYPEKFEASLQKLAESLSAKLGKKIEMKATASKTLIGGFRVRTDDNLIDASVEGRLKAMAKRLMR